MSMNLLIPCNQVSLTGTTVLSLLRQATYSPIHGAPCDFWLFFHLKMRLKATQFCEKLKSNSLPSYFICFHEKDSSIYLLLLMSAIFFQTSYICIPILSKQIIYIRFYIRVVMRYKVKIKELTFYSKTCDQNSMVEVVFVTIFWRRVGYPTGV